MKTATLAGIVLVVLGMFTLAYQEFTYTTQKKVVDIGGLHASVDEKHHVPLSPVLGGILLAGGLILLVSGSKAAVAR